LNRDVALKVLTIAPDASFADRFQREAHTLAGLSHPGIVSVIDYGQRGPWSFLVMEFVDGASLRQMLRARELGPREALSIVSQVCDALQYAHDHGVVHRDIKPENILVTRDARVKVLDFGLAKLVGGVARDNLTREQQVMGTPHYMAPEQWEKPQTVDHRADIYALGVVFYELLTGELPIGRFAPPSHKVTLDVRLDDVVLRTLEKEPERRYQRAGEVKDAVTGIGATPASPTPVNAPLVTRPPRSTGRKIAVGVAIGCGALVIVGAVLAAVFLVFLPARQSAAVTASKNAGTVVSPSDVTAESSSLGAQQAHDLGLLESATKLELPPNVATILGIDEASASKLNAEWRRVWSQYVALETRQTTFVPPRASDRARIRVRAAREEREDLVRRATGVLDEAVRGNTRGRDWLPGLRKHIDSMLRFGATDERLEIVRSGEEFTVTSLSPDDEESTIATRRYRTPLPTWVVGMWLREHPFEGVPR